MDVSVGGRGHEFHRDLWHGYVAQIVGGEIAKNSLGRRDLPSGRTALRTDAASDADRAVSLGYLLVDVSPKTVCPNLGK